MLSFAVPEGAPPEGCAPWLQVSGRLDAGGGMSWHAFEEESETAGWEPGKTYEAQIDAAGLDYLEITAGLQRDGGLLAETTFTIAPDGTVRTERSED